ncbi:MAG: hypothetical protein ABIK96_07330 [bacterium]
MMSLRVLNSIRAVPSYSPISERVGRMCRSTSAWCSPWLYCPAGQRQNSLRLVSSCWWTSSPHMNPSAE